MSDRRRINGPPSGTSIPTYVAASTVQKSAERVRRSNELRKIFLKTGLVPTASGSAYLELETPSLPSQTSFLPTTPTIKLTCSVHGPLPVSRTSSFSPNLQLNTTIKFAPFAARLRRGYIRDASERDLSTHLDTALKGVIIPDRWPKSALHVIVTVLESEDVYGHVNQQQYGVDGVGMMNILAGCITVASAALADAKIDCLDLLAGGVSAYLPGQALRMIRVLDPCPTEHEDIKAACVVGYLPSRDEVTEVWCQGSLVAAGTGSFEDLLDGSINSARAAHVVLQEAVRESAERWTQEWKDSDTKKNLKETKINDVEMKI